MAPSLSRHGVLEKKRGHLMWGMITQPELATAIVDRADALSLLGGGLVGLRWLAVGLIVWMATCAHLFQVTTSVAAERWPSGRLAAWAKWQLPGFSASHA